jgi:hypothetical protein
MEGIKRLQGSVKIASIGNCPKRPIRDRPREPLAASAEARREIAMKSMMLALALLLGLAASGIGTGTALAQGAPPGSNSWGNTSSNASR